MTRTWKITMPAPRRAVEAALLAHEDAADWDPAIVLAGSAIASGQPGAWHLEAWLPRRPTGRDRAALSSLFAASQPRSAPRQTVEELPDRDWLTLSQQGLEPIRAGCFHVHAPDRPPTREPGVFDLVIPASRAFGTGQHATTAGCLAVLTEMKRRGTPVRNFADIGTGTGLLAFAALALWPRALATASDIDPVCADVVADNARANHVRLGAGAGELTVTVADGLDDPLLAARGPYDLVVANILAGPLIALAPAFGHALIPGGQLLLAGLLEAQEPHVRRACRLAGFRLAGKIVIGDWSVLWLRRRHRVAVRSNRAAGFDDWIGQR